MKLMALKLLVPTKCKTIPTGLEFLCHPCHRIPCGYPRPSDFCLTKQQHPSINVQLTKALFSSLGYASFFQPNATHEVLRGLLFSMYVSHVLNFLSNQSKFGDTRMSRMPSGQGEVIWKLIYCMVTHRKKQTIKKKKCIVLSRRLCIL